MPRAPRDGTLLICATPRCGSTYFCGLLRQTGAGGWPGEWLGRAGEQHFRELYELPATMDFAAFVRELRGRRCGEDGTFSVKAMWPHFLQFVQRGREAAGLGEETSDLGVLEHFFGPVRILYLYREDSLAQAISLYRARRSRLWHELSDQGHYLHLEVPYDHAAIAEHLKWIRYHNRLWRWFFRRCEVEDRVVERRFEDFIQASPDRLMRETLAELGLNPPAAQLELQPPTRRQSDGLSRRWRERFEARLERATHFPGSSHDGPYPAAAYAIAIELEQDFFTVTRGEHRSFEVLLTNQSEHTWMDVGGDEGQREAVLAIELTDAEGRLHRSEQALHEPLPAGVRQRAEWSLPDHLAPGLYALAVDLFRRGEARVSDHGGHPARAHLWVEADPRPARAADYFGSLAAPSAAGPLEVPWLGPIGVEYFPWIRHPQIEWMRCAGTGVAGDDFWFFIPDLGLVTTTEEAFPRLFVPACGVWLTFEGVEENAKVFRREDTGERLAIRFQAYELPFRADPVFA